jgi:hypothetical protein
MSGASAYSTPAARCRSVRAHRIVGRSVATRAWTGFGSIESVCADARGSGLPCFARLQTSLLVRGHFHPLGRQAARLWRIYGTFL